jgi:uncharacterized protein
MTTNNPLPTVRRMFEAFAKGDLDRLLDTVHPDSRWTDVGANPRPVKRVYVGREDIRKFFDRILQNLTMTTFHPREFVTENDTVVVISFEAGTVKATGGSVPK